MRRLGEPKKRLCERDHAAGLCKTALTLAKKTLGSVAHGAYPAAQRAARAEMLNYLLENKLVTV
jgi:hypothetical protein